LGFGLGLTGQRLPEFGNCTDKAGPRFVDEASGQPSDTQVCSELPWSSGDLRRETAPN
jgi:hypothetical protein